MPIANRVAAVVRAILLLCWAVSLPGMAQAQQDPPPSNGFQSPILTIESDRLFTDSLYGQRVTREVEAESAVLSAENRRIEAELTAEEKDLTERRAEMEPDAFRTLADAFDAKVQSIRETQDGKARALAQRAENGRVAFFQSARPVLEQLMRETGATVLLERSSVFLSANATDVTALAIARIDAALGEGPASGDTPDQ